jgi:hypothetical protein
MKSTRSTWRPLGRAPVFLKPNSQPHCASPPALYNTGSKAGATPREPPSHYSKLSPATPKFCVKWRLATEPVSDGSTCFRLSRPAATKSAASAHSATDRIYFGNAEYPRGFAGGIALKLHCFFPHFEHRIRFATSSSRASHPHNRPKVCDSCTIVTMPANKLRPKSITSNTACPPFSRRKTATHG